MTRSRSFLSSKKILKRNIFSYVKGFIGSRNHLYKVASKAFIKSLLYSKRDRYKRSNILKKKYINLVSNYLSFLNITYSSFKYFLKKNNIILNIKMFYYIILFNKKGFYFFSIIKYLIN